MSIYKGDKKVAGLGATRRNIGEIVSSILPLTDAGLHLLDGAVISGNGIYGKFVTYIAGLVSSYPNLFISEADWQSSVNTYGVCGKFVYDSANNTVRLPKITGIIEGTTDTTALGDLVEAGLPNITGTGVNTEVAWNTVRTSTTGAFQLSAVGTNNDRGVPSGNTCTYAWWEFDASLSNPIYGKSNTVQPQTIKAYYYICVAASVKPNIEADMDQIATDLNSRARIDLANLSNAGKIVGAGLGMPSRTYDSLSMPASGGVVTAPADGWFWLGGIVDNVSAVTRVVMRRTSDRFGVAFGTQGVTATGGWTGGILPVKKGDTVALYYVNITADHSFRFYYAEGSKTEAN